MTERRQTKFKEKIDNQNYVIYIGICSLAIVVLYVYRFHFATITISYVLGCLACYFTLKSYIFNNYLEQVKRNFVKNSLENGFDNVLSKGCVTCGSKDCNRHDGGATSEPWTGLQVHKQLDQAIEEFYNTILDQFICSWYNKITPQPFFVDELRHQLRYASACLLGRAVKINYSRFITERLLPCALRHYTLCAELSDTSPLLDSKMAVHPAAANRNAELKYLRCVTNAIVPYLLRHGDVESSVFRVLIREIFAGWVLLSLTDVLADPYILNSLIVLATGDETMAELPTTPDYGVEFLETFARQSDTVYTARSKMFKLDLDLVLNDQDYFYAFMQFLKTTSHIHLLQFYKDIKSFQTKLLNPELAPSEEESLINEAWDIYSTYFDSASPSCVHLDQSLGIEMKSLLKNREDCIKKLQTSRALYQAARQSHAALDKVMLPRFLHSEQFYNLLIGSRVPTGYQKQLTKKQQEKLILQALKIGNKLKGALKPQILDGQVLDNINSDSSDSENVDIDILKYLDNDSKRDQDLSTCKVVITHIESRIQAPPRRGTVRYFTIAVHRVEKRASASFWSVERSEHDFHLLRSKLIEFHADKLLQDLPLPSRRDNSPMETLRYKYEDFLQRLLQKSLLQTSELLHIFLTVEGDFSPVVQASSLTANSTDFTNIYQSVTHKLRKEKGQHLECFLKSFLVSSDVERFQAAKQPIPVEEAMEVNEDAPTHHRECPRDIMSSCFGDNFGVEPAVAARDWRHQDKVVGFTQCVVYLLKKVLKAPAVITGLIGSVLTLTRDVIDDVTNSLLDSALRKLLNERTLAHLIRLGHELLFGKKAGLPREDSSIQRERAKRQLMACIPSPVTRLGTGIPEAVLTAFQIIQRPQLNKQLVYNLLDLCLMELFPELDTARNETEEPKS